MKYLIILNDPPYGTERRITDSGWLPPLLNRKEPAFRFCSWAMPHQTTPDGYYNIERMLKLLADKSYPVGVCSSCMDARGIKEEMLARGTHRSSMNELTEWTQAADKILVF